MSKLQWFFAIAIGVPVLVIIALAAIWPQTKMEQQRRGMAPVVTEVALDTAREAPSWGFAFWADIPYITDTQ